MNGRGSLEDLDIDKYIMIIAMLKKVRWEVVGLIGLIHDRDSRWHFLNIIVKFEFQNFGKIFENPNDVSCS